MKSCLEAPLPQTSIRDASERDSPSGNPSGGEPSDRHTFKRDSAIRHGDTVIVIGGGPAGLAAALELTALGKRAVLLEKNAIVGGLARTESFGNNLFDLGGHRFYTQVPEIERLWTDLLGRDLLRRPRLSRIYYRKRFFHYPLKPLNALRGLGLFESVLIITSYIRWHLFPYRHEDSFEQWVTNRFGKRLFSTFFKSYTEKVWGISCHRLKAEWAAQRIRDLSLRSLLQQAFSGSKRPIRTLITEFYYPRRGPGMMWQAMHAAIERQGGELRLGSEVVRIRRQDGGCWCVEISSDGRIEQITGSALISSMPITEFVAKLDPAPRREVLDAANQLSYRSFLTVCLVVDKPDLFPDNWIYVHEPGVSVARIQNFKNWSPDLLDDPSKTTLGLEYFCAEGDALWSLPDAELVALGSRELEQIGLAQSSSVEDGCVFRVPKAYPVYDSGYRAHLDLVRAYVDQLTKFRTAGRNGLHRYDNQDQAMLSGILAVRSLVLDENHDLWQTNGTKGYLEQARVDEGTLAA